MSRAKAILKSDRKKRAWYALAIFVAVVALLYACTRGYFIVQGYSADDSKSIKSEEMLSGARSEVELLGKVIADRDLQIASLRGELQLAKAVPAETVNDPNAMVVIPGPGVDVSPGVKTNGVPGVFNRNPHKRLVDDLNNPGGLLLGDLSKPFCPGAYRANGYVHAVCDTRAWGVAALINMIMTHKGRQIKHYIGGGDGRDDPWWNYTGGNAKATAVYLDTFEDVGINTEHRINGNLDQLKRLIRGHARVEGSQIPVTDEEISEALALYQGSK